MTEARISRRSQALFAALILSQAAHSIEEYRFELWEVLAPARLLSRMVSSNLPLGFAIFNIALFAFGAWCFFAWVRRPHRWGIACAWGWTALEAANGTGHLLFAAVRGRYFPGAATAPLLLGVSAALGMSLLREGNRDGR